MELIEAARRGDEDAFARLVLDNEKRVFTLCSRLAGSPEDGAELAQEAFFKAWKGLNNFQGDSSFSTWIYRLATNVCIDFLRKERRRKAASMTVSLDDDEEERQLELPDDSCTPDRELERTELREAIQAGLERLSPEHRQILIMREINGLSYAEIGMVLDLEEGTVKSRIARARGALRKVLLESGNFSEWTAST